MGAQSRAHRIKISVDVSEEERTYIKMIAAKKKMTIREFMNYRECHVRNDLLLIYKIDKKTSSLYLARFGSHSECVLKAFQKD